MPKIKEYPDVPFLYDDNQFITERYDETGNVSYGTEKVSFLNLWKRVWQLIMSYIQYDNDDTIAVEKNDLKLNIRGHRTGPWDSNKRYMYGDLCTSSADTGNNALYWCYGHTSGKNWEEHKSKWNFICSADYWTSFTFKPDEWSDTAPYTCTKSVTYGVSDRSCFVMDYYSGDVESYICIDNISFNTSTKELTFTCNNKKPENTFEAKCKITYDHRTDENNMFIMHRHIEQINDEVNDSTKKSWSSKKIMEILSIFMDLNKIRVTNLPETGATGTVYTKLLDNENKLLSNKTISYEEYAWSNSQNSYEILGTNASLLLPLSPLPDIAGEENVYYLTQNTENENQYDEYIWNDSTQSFVINGSYQLSSEQINHPIEIEPSPSLLYDYEDKVEYIENEKIKSFYYGTDNIVYSIKQTNEDGSEIYNMYVWDNNKYILIGSSAVRPNVKQFNIGARLRFDLSSYPVNYGIEGVIYEDQDGYLLMWNANLQTFIQIGELHMSRYPSYKTVDTLPETGASGTVYVLLNSEDSKYDYYNYIDGQFVLVGEQ
jgi:hypothetical protein